MYMFSSRPAGSGGFAQGMVSSLHPSWLCLDKSHTSSARESSSLYPGAFHVKLTVTSVGRLYFQHGNVLGLKVLLGEYFCKEMLVPFTFLPLRI